MFNYRKIELISQDNKVMFNILQVRLRQFMFFDMNQELPDIQLDLEKAEEPEIKLPTSGGS